MALGKNNNRQNGTTINKEYFSGTQTSLFIGDVWVDDILSIEYNVQDSKTPKYGYGSQHFDFVTKGSMLVTGSFIINFREPNYLWLLIERYRTFNGRDARLKGVVSQKESEVQEQINEQRAQTYEVDKRSRLDDFFNSPDARKAKTNLIDQRLLAQAREFDGVPEPQFTENFNHASFNILMGYGYTLGPDSPGETIKDVHIVGKTKQINSDGRPIAEQYSFIARNIK